MSTDNGNATPPESDGKAPESTNPVTVNDDAFSTKKRRWTRPVAMAKDSNTFAWLIFASIICLVIALWAPMTKLYWQLRNRTVESDSKLPRTADCFVAISYEGVAAEEESSGKFIRTDVFKSHIMALREAGYHPIGIDDVRAFYYENKLLPEKAILVTFENSHKSTYFETREIISDYHWRATMGVVTHKVSTDDMDTILRPYLKTMAMNARWDLASESDRGTEFIPVSPNGRTSPFFSSPMWLENEKRYEKFEEFTNRIELDHLASIKEFTENIGVKPVAFFFPMGNYGQFDENNRNLREANLEAVARHFDLGFILNNHALNESGTDHHRLNRMPIQPSMTASELVAILENSWPVQAKRGKAAGQVQVARWVEDWGIIEKNGNSFILRATPASDQRISDADATGGARAWISGSSPFIDGTFETRFKLTRGEFHVYLRFRADDNWVQVVVNDNGHASVSQNIPGEAPTLIATDAIKNINDFRTMHNLLVTMRNDIIYVRLDGKLLFNGAVHLLYGADITAGLVGLGVWAPQAGLAQTEVYDCTVRSRLDSVITWAPSISRDTSYLVDQLNDNAFRYTIIAPPWLDVYPSSPITFPALDAQALNVIAKANNNRIYPTLAVHAVEALPHIDKEEVVENLVADNADGILIDAGDYPVAQLAALKSWSTELGRLLDKRGMGLAIRFPVTVSQLATITTSFTASEKALIVEDNGNVPTGVDPDFVLGRIIIPPPASDENLSLFFQLADYDNITSDDLPEAEGFRRKGMKAYAEGKYDVATNYWGQWCRVEPRNPEAWTFLGNAYSRLRDSEDAINAYGESLMLNPGQIKLVIERARLMESIGRDDEAEKLLDVYARAFPDNSEITIAQANWLDRHDKRSLGREMLTRVVTNRTDDINSRLTLHSLLDNPADRYRNMHELLAIGNGGASQLLGFGHDIAASEILTMPEASVFFDFIRHTATNAPNETVKSVFSDFLPFTDEITERFDASRLSENWIALGSSLATIAGAYTLQAASDMSEAYLRLKKSELLRDGFIEVSIGESVGAFWLYARRSAKAMIRFGFDGDGYLRIQSWTDGDIRTGDSRAWIRPAGDITLRLEVRGDGAIGYVDGKPMFTTPLMIPQDITYGWWSIAPFSPELGIARARIGRISAGPLSPSLVMMRELDPEKIADSLDFIRDNIRDISAISPAIFIQSPDGHVLSTPLADLMPFRMFCSYHRIRLIPAVALDYYSDVEPKTLLKIIKDNRLSGLVLTVRSMPNENWFNEMTDLLEETSADLIVIQRDVPIFSDQKVTPEENIAVMREIQRGSVLFQPNQQTWSVPLQNYRTWKPGKNNPPCMPNLLFLKDEIEESAAAPSDESAPLPAVDAKESTPDGKATPTEEATKTEGATQVVPTKTPATSEPLANAIKDKAENAAEAVTDNVAAEPKEAIKSAPDKIVDKVEEANNNK